MGKMITESTNKQILYVGELAAGRDQLQRHSGSNAVHFAPDARQALDRMSGEPRIDAIVCHAGLPGFSGASFIDEVTAKFPDLPCIWFSPSGPSAAKNPRVIPGTSELAELLPLLTRVLQLRERLADVTVREVVGKLDTLPSVPSTYWALVEAASMPNGGSRDIARIVQSDPAMSLRVLQVVNSAFFGLGTRVSSIPQAVDYLGAELLKALVLTAHVFSAMGTRPIRGFSLERFQRYAIRVARFARRFCDDPAMAEEVFTAGILRDIGQLVLAVQHPAEFSAMLERSARTGESIRTFEREVFGVTQSDVGAFLLSNWRIPFSIVECTAYCHTPGELEGPDLGVLAVVHAADALAGIVLCGEPEETLDLRFLERTGHADQIPRWRRMIEVHAAK
jgi:HD-like signal output (HDOD) protein/CheY-like chemotaxis protein